MKARLLQLCSIGIACGFVLTLSAQAASDVPRPKYDQPVPNLPLKDVTGKTHGFSASGQSKGVCVTFMGLGCPLSNLYTPRLQSIADRFGAKGITFLVVNSNYQDSAEELAQAATKYGLKIPVLKDHGNKVADAFGVYRTNEVFLLDGNRRIVYHGAIDDQYGIGYQRPRADHHFLVDALSDLSAGRPIAVARTQAVGCVVGREFKGKSTAKVTYHNQVERIFQQNCQMCHREGQIGPFPLKTYEDAKGWAGMIKEVVTQKRMPPWPANPDHGSFSNDRSLAQAEIDQIVAWVDGGTPQGDPADAPLGVAFPRGDWIIGEPDVVFEMPEAFPVPAEGVVDYQYFRVGTNFDEDKWVTAVEVLPGEPSVVHHVIAFVRPHDQAEDFIQQEQAFSEASKRQNERIDKGTQGQAGRTKSKSGGLLPDGVGASLARLGEESRRGRGGFASGILVGNVPGNMPFVAPKGGAKLLPKGADIIFQMHYTPNGTRCQDRTKIGLVLSKEAPTHSVWVTSAGNFQFRIPPHDGHYQVGAKFPVKKSMQIISFLPHMHLRGKAFTYEVVYPDGRSEILLDVPRYDFGWQITYKLEEPKFIPEGSEIFCRAVFDNSEENPWNPDPSQEVRWGDQTWEEMMLGWFTFMIPEKDDSGQAQDDRVLSEPRAALD